MKQWWPEEGTSRVAVLISGAFAILILAGLIAYFLPLGEISYREEVAAVIASLENGSNTATSTSADANSATTTEPVFVATHVPTPAAVKAVYMTSWAAGSSKFREHLYDLVDNTEVNSVVIDVKDYTGRISFKVNDPLLVEMGAYERRIPDVREFIAELHKRNVYVIARISVFQDSYLINVKPEWAVKTQSGAIWQDYKGVKWLDAGARPVWDYIVALGKESYAVGFDELNFDYIRFPSDGDLEDIAYPWSKDRSRTEVMKDFYQYIHQQFSGTGIPTSADLFGLTTSADDDLGIGQLLELALESFDYVAPMIYPSHYGRGFNGYPKPAEHPYEMIKDALDDAVDKAQATTTRVAIIGNEPIASTSPQLYTKSTYDVNKIRPWLQAFDLGAIYTPEMVRKQIDATYDAGMNSWMLWNAASVYKKDALLPK